jgi:hypothetical protein
MKPVRPDRPRVLLVGGEGRKNIQLKNKVESFGVEVTHIWERGDAASKRSMPNVDLILLMTDVLGHKDEEGVKKLNKGSIPMRRTGKGIEAIGAAIASYFGYEQPPKRGGRNEAESQERKIWQAGARMKDSFASWVKQVQGLRGKPLTQGDPYRPMREAMGRETWYDVWLEGTSPEEAAKLGSRNLL